MSDEESTPRKTRRGRPAAASAAKVQEEKAPATPRGRAAKKVAESASTTEKKKRGEPSTAVIESDQEEVTSTPRGRAAKKQAEKAMTTGKKGKKEPEKEVTKSFEMSDSEEIEIVKTVKPKRGKPAAPVKEEVVEEEVEASDSEEDEPRASRSSQRSSSQSAAKSKEKTAAAAPSSSKPSRGRRAAGGGDKDDAAREEEEWMNKETRPASKAAKRGRKAADSVQSVEDEEEEEERPATRASRRGKKDEEEKETRPVARSTRKGRKANEDNEEEEEEEGMEESPRKKAKLTEKEKEKGPSTTRARRRIDYEEGESSKKEEKGKKKGGVDKDLLPIETPKKKETTKKKEDSDRAAAVYVGEEDDIKPFAKFKPSFVDDENLRKKQKKKKEKTEKVQQKQQKGSSDSSEEESDSSDSSESEEEEESEEDGDESDDVIVEGTKGVQAASHAKSKDLKTAKEAICASIRKALMVTFEQKDTHSFTGSLTAMLATRAMAYDRKNYDETARAYYDEIENQMTNMMMKDEKESKADVEAKKRVLNVIAMSFAKEFESADSLAECEMQWNQIDYLLNKFACAEDTHIRSFFCYWIGCMQKYSKEVHHEKHGASTAAALERLHEQRRKEEGGDGTIDEDRRLIDGHIFHLSARRQLYGVLYTSLKHDDIDVRIAAIRSLSIVQDDPIPPNHIEAMKHSPKDLIMKQLLDVHVSVRRAAMEELRPSTDQQIEILLHAARNEKHEKERILAFSQLGRLPIIRFNLQQRHLLLGMIKDNRIGQTIEKNLLRSWLFEMVTGENPNPIIVPTVQDGVKGGVVRKKAVRMNDDEMVEKWMAAPLKMLRYLDCVYYSDDVLEILRKGSQIARKSGNLHNNQVSVYIQMVIEVCDRERLTMITMGDFKQILDRDLSDDARAVLVTFWLHLLQFIHEKARDEAEQLNALMPLSPSMGDLRGLIMDLLDDEKERISLRKAMIEDGEVDPTNPAFIQTSDKLLSVVTNFMTSFRYLRHGDDDAMREWRRLLIDLTCGGLIDVSPALWEVIMHDLLTFHCKEDQRDDLIYEVAVGMGFNFDEAIRGGKSGSPSKTSRTPTKKTTMASDDPSTPVSSNEDVKKREEEEKKRQDKIFVLSRPRCLGLLHGALKTTYFKGKEESFAILAKAELDAYRSIGDARLRAICLECIGILGIYSESVAERYIGLVMENLLRATSDTTQDDVEERERVARDQEEEEKKKKRRRKMKVINPDELEKDYERREKEDRERRDEEMMRRRGGKDNCKGLALTVIADLIVAHSEGKVENWLSKCDDNYKMIALYTHMEALSQEPDFELLFKVLHSTCKLALHNRNLMQPLNKTMAQLQFRAFHPTSFSHSQFRACAIGFNPLFGSRSVANQMALTEVVITMLSMLKDTAIEYRNLIDRGGNAARAIANVVWSCAPSSLKVPPNGVRPQNTAHGVLLRKLGQELEACGEDARMELSVDMEYYKALLDAVAGIELSGQTANGLRSLYDVLFTNMDMMAHSDKAGEAKKKATRLLKTVEGALDVVNEIIRQNMALGITLTDKEVRLPFEDEHEKVFEELRMKAESNGIDLNSASPIKDGRSSTTRVPGSAIRGTPATAKRRAAPRTIDSERNTGLKKEPARSKSYAAAAAAERKEAAAKSSSSNSMTTPSRSSTRLNRARGTRAAKMPTIDESGDSDRERL